ncbi:MAG: urea ABC transporter ATP-binding subunit UrtE [Candidatus Competibacteraceae bacterium]|nr:urea ABC transporter ATP-binding subunit UrtE [Candidatus Competibacteraceae bacterium]
MLNVDGLNQYYGASHILWDIALTVPQGGCTCLMGRNGVGKTTLLKTIMGLVPIRSGAIEFAGQKMNKVAAHQRARLGIGYVPQGRQIFPQLTVEENLRIGLNARRDQIKTIPEHIFEMFPVLKTMLRRRGGDLSGGQQQQLAIGRALAIAPELLILDEPTEGIQPNIVHEIGDVIMKLNQEQNLTVLLVEQKLPFARRVAKDFCIMEKGRAVAAGQIADLNDELVQRHLSV